jgi:hypothetical protein
MENWKGVPLNDLLHGHSFFTDESIQWKITRQILEALHYIHSHSQFMVLFPQKTSSFQMGKMLNYLSFYQKSQINSTHKQLSLLILIYSRSGFWCFKYDALSEALKKDYPFFLI